MCNFICLCGVVHCYVFLFLIIVIIILIIEMTFVIF